VETSALTERGQAADTDGQWPLAGRDSLVSRITTVLSASKALAVVLHGPSGIGKSRLADEAAKTLETLSWTTVRLSARTGLASMPLGGLAPLFAHEQADFPALSRDPVALLSSAASRVRAIAGTGNVLLLVDDISVMDALSISVIAQLVHTKAVKLLATIGEGQPIPDAVLSMWTESAALRIDLGPLDSSECAQLLSAALGGSVALRTAEELCRAGGGSPLFVRELTLGALAAGKLVNVAGVWQLLGGPVGTPALHDVIARRLDAMPAEQRDAVERLALCQPLPIRELRAEGARSALRELENSGLVAIVETGGRVTASLAQPHYVAVVRAGMSLLRVEDILLEQAEIVSQGPMTGDDAFRIAVWRLDAGHPSDPELLVGGARLAQGVHDHAQAAKLARAAIEAGHRGAAAHLILADALRRTGAADLALVAAETAATVDGSEPTSDALSAQIATTLALIRHDQPGGIDAALAVLDDAQRRLPLQAPAITIARSMMLFTVERASEALDEIAPLLALPEQPPALRSMVAMAAAMPLAAAGRATEAAAEVRLLLDGAPAERDRAFALFTAASASLLGGSFETARDFALDALYESIRFDDEVSTRYAELLLGHALLDTGDITAALRWIRDAVSGAQTKGPLNLNRVALGTLAIALVLGGDARAAESALADIDEAAPEGNFHTRLAKAMLAAERGNPAKAIEDLRAAAAEYEASGVLYLATSLLFQAARIGGAKQVAPMLDSLAARGDSPLFAARARHARALAEGDADGLADAGEEWLRLGATLYAAEAFATASVAARASNSIQLSLTLLQRSQSLAALCEGAMTPALRAAAAPDVLTKREREIADLAGRGLTSQEIATQLFLSVRTVDNHLQSSYGKLGVAGRRELAQRR
jgi:DNA-binding CsgD family transcriptional regulator